MVIFYYIARSVSYSWLGLKKKLIFIFKVSTKTLTSLMVERDIPNIFVQVQVSGENLFHHTHVYGVLKIYDFLEDFFI